MIVYLRSSQTDPEMIEMFYKWNHSLLGRPAETTLLMSVSHTDNFDEFRETLRAGGTVECELKLIQSIAEED